MVTMFWPISVREEIIHQDIGRPGELPDIDLMKDSMFMILDQDAYYNSQSSVGFRPMQELTEMEHPMFRSQPRNIL